MLRGYLLKRTVDAAAILPSSALLWFAHARAYAVPPCRFWQRVLHAAALQPAAFSTRALVYR